MKTVTPYRPSRHPAPIDLKLDSNEGRPPSSPPSVPTRGLERYPDASVLCEALARRHGLARERVLVTAGADDALLRICLAFAGPGTQAIAGVPTFEMIPRYLAMSGAELVGLPWPGGAFPVEAVRRAAGERTRVLFVVSPNNPTGAVVGAPELRALRRALPEALLVLDHAYVELAQEDLTEVALELPRTLVLRTFSKAWGLAGARVGYALGPAAEIARLAASGNPYPVARPSCELALDRLRSGAAEMEAYVARVRVEREALRRELVELGFEVPPSQANFVYLRDPAARWLRDGLAGLGIAVRSFEEGGEAGAALRISCPAEPDAFERLLDALRCCRSPGAWILDLDSLLRGEDSCHGDPPGEEWRSRPVDRPMKRLADRLGEWFGAMREQRRRPRIVGFTSGSGEALLGRLEAEGCPDGFDELVTRDSLPAPGEVGSTLEAALARTAGPPAWLLTSEPASVRAARERGVLPIGVCGEPAGSRASRALLEAGAARVWSDWRLEWRPLLEVTR